MILNTLLSRDLLIDAYKFYSREDARAHDALSIIMKRGEMAEAVTGCLDQGSQEEEPQKQQLYMNAACFGKKFAPDIAIEQYQSTCRRLRVMNILRNEKIDPSTDIETAIEILISWKKFQLALWMVEYLRIEGESHIREKWCEFLLEQYQMRDEQVVDRIQKILGPHPVVPYADIANKSIEKNRIQLAIKLIEKESHALKQIPLLLSLKQYDLVLAQALSSCDSNLIYMSIFKLKESIPSEIPFLELLKKHHLASEYYRNYLFATDMPKLIMISHRDNSDDELLYCLLDNRQESALSVAKKIRRDAIPEQIEVSMRLNKFQQSLSSIGSPPKAQQPNWVGLSISQTIINLIAIGQSSKAKDAQKKFDISDKKYRVLEQIACDILPKLSIPDIAI